MPDWNTIVWELRGDAVASRYVCDVLWHISNPQPEGKHNPRLAELAMALRVGYTFAEVIGKELDQCQ